MTKDEALTLALEALERGETKLRWEAITAIKEALAQPELAKLKVIDGVVYTLEWTPQDLRPAKQPEGTLISTALAEQQFGRYFRQGYDEGVGAQRTWVGLTLDERLELAQDVDWAAGAYCEYAEKVEAKLKEKNT